MSFLLSCDVPLLARTLHLHSKCEGSHTALRYLRSAAEHTLQGAPLRCLFLLSCGVLLFGFEPCASALKVRLSQPKIEELALQAQVVDIFAKGEYPPGRVFKISAKIYLLPQINPSVIFLGKMPPPFTQRRLICGIPSEDALLIYHQICKITNTSSATYGDSCLVATRSHSRKKRH